MLLSLLRLDFRQAFLDNAYVLCILPILIPWGIWRTKGYIDEDIPRFGKFETMLLILLLAGAVVFAIIRNT